MGGFGDNRNRGVVWLKRSQRLDDGAESQGRGSEREGGLFSERLIGWLLVSA
jgi:hypothetical protein